MRLHVVTWHLQLEGLGSGPQSNNKGWRDTNGYVTGVLMVRIMRGVIGTYQMMMAVRDQEANWPKADICGTIWSVPTLVAIYSRCKEWQHNVRNCDITNSFGCCQSTCSGMPGG